jgi:GNAT superfamily N-acetyltransferase
MALVLHPVRTAEDRRRYEALAVRLYRDCLYWIPTLWGSEQAALDPAQNPAFAEAEAQAWLALRDGEAVGRLTVLINHRETAHLGRVEARFGWTDFVDDPEVSRALLAAAERWAREQGAVALKGPYGFSSLDPAGWVVAGFDTLGSFATRYNYPYYPEHLQAFGFDKLVDWVEYRLPVPDHLPRRVEQVRRLLPQRYGLRYRPLQSRAELMRLAPQVIEVLLSSYKPLEGWVPLSQAQQQQYLQSYFPYLRPDFVGLVVDAKERVIGFGVTLPSLARAMQKSAGRLWPWGWYHLWRAQRRNQVAELILIGAIPEWQGKGLPGLIFAEVYQVFRRMGIREVRVHPMMEQNQAVQRLFKDYDLELFRRRRVWRKAL